MIKKPVVLFYDIESTPLTSYTWGKYEQNVIAVKKDWELLSFAFKYDGDKKVRVYSRRNLSERQLVTKLHRTLNEADLVVTHNGISFDNKKANAKFIEFGLKPVYPAKQIDTYRIAKSQFNFSSNKLDDLGQLLKVGKKLNTGGFDLWLKCMAEDKKAFKLMERYNKNDVILLEKVYLKLRPFAKGLPNLTLLSGLWGCPSCNSIKIIKRGLQANTANVMQSWGCNNCGHRFLTSRGAKVGK